LANGKGLSDNEMEDLVQSIKNLARELIGNEMIYEISQVINNKKTKNEKIYIYIKIIIFYLY